MLSIVDIITSPFFVILHVRRAIKSYTNSMLVDSVASLNTLFRLFTESIDCLWEERNEMSLSCVSHSILWEKAGVFEGSGIGALSIGFLTTQWKGVARVDGVD